MSGYRLRGRLIDLVLYGSVALILAFFYIPIVTLVAFSFTDSRFLVLPFPGLSLCWYGALFEQRDFLTALTNSAIIAAAVTLAATLLGTGAAIAWVRYLFRGKRFFQAVAFAPLLFPQLLLGVVLLLWFSLLGNWFNFSNGLWSAILGQIIYVAPFAMVIISVQVQGFDDTLEDAARDAGASRWTVFREITLPLIWPGIVSAAIFAFLLSWGNFYISYSLAGSERTIPTFVFAGIAVGSSPIYPALATITFVPALLLILVADHLRRRAARKQRPVEA